MKQKKRFFLFGGYSGIIYYSWLLVLLFLTIILSFESVNGFNWWPVATGALFIIWLIYSIFGTYYVVTSGDYAQVKLPFIKQFSATITNKKQNGRFYATGVFIRANHTPINFFQFTKTK
ncbi:hypothetical protein FC62_GL000210 [Amylolactobacillus amylotrophicus DSM 20534]|uniref:Uncharacterized protein n=3 Tax=Amylolactobacillus TaxID=2767876 RepID=A0A1L6XDZ4_9LACO|nr:MULTISPECIES: hypothetical protein [Amylolactobacillus]APT19202.1 hypothetical protein LA20533_08055 [Amylolactobacillus amylophilus DSM 20533 = JCM 1125]KRK38523.1 hypothetical protein FC62_GL000210 [Amylolactobacillus amylotrophicus DSM 20534]KRM42834.1 hypothetical protein FD40_GL000629 [Amylolactobacillus amylophilus DSM 20533 = JCM 1125]GED79697.1 hypothetical protein LAM01_01700 [Amylolactobacillus amylophilus]